MKIYNPFLKLFIFLSFCSLIIGQVTETAYIKYYLSDRDFIADAPIFATARREKAHLEVTFNENKHPVLKRWLNEKHELIRDLGKYRCRQSCIPAIWVNPAIPYIRK